MSTSLSLMSQLLNLPQGTQPKGGSGSGHEFNTEGLDNAGESSFFQALSKVLSGQGSDPAEEQSKDGSQARLTSAKDSKDSSDTANTLTPGTPIKGLSVTLLRPNAGENLLSLREALMSPQNTKEPRIDTDNNLGQKDATPQSNKLGDSLAPVHLSQEFPALELSNLATNTIHNKTSETERIATEALSYFTSQKAPLSSQKDGTTGSSSPSIPVAETQQDVAQLFNVLGGESPNTKSLSSDITSQIKNQDSSPLSSTDGSRLPQTSLETLDTHPEQRVQNITLDESTVQSEGLSSGAPSPVDAIPQDEGTIAKGTLPLSGHLSGENVTREHSAPPDPFIRPVESQIPPKVQDKSTDPALGRDVHSIAQTDSAPSLSTSEEGPLTISPTVFSSTALASNTNHGSEGNSSLENLPESTASIPVNLTQPSNTRPSDLGPSFMEPLGDPHITNTWSLPVTAEKPGAEAGDMDLPSASSTPKVPAVPHSSIDEVQNLSMIQVSKGESVQRDLVAEEASALPATTSLGDALDPTMSRKQSLENSLEEVPIQTMQTAPLEGLSNALKLNETQSSAIPPSGTETNILNLKTDPSLTSSGQTPQSITPLGLHTATLEESLPEEGQTESSLSSTTSPAGGPFASRFEVAQPLATSTESSLPTSVGITSSTSSTSALVTENALNPLSPGGIIDQVANETASSIQMGRSEVQLRLNPNHLGSVRITLSSIQEGQVQARFVVERPEAQHALQEHISHLQQSLSDKGVQLERIAVVLAGKGLIDAVGESAAIANQQSFSQNPNSDSSAQQFSNSSFQQNQGFNSYQHHPSSNRSAQHLDGLTSKTETNSGLHLEEDHGHESGIRAREQVRHPESQISVLV